MASELTAREMADLLIERIRQRRDMRDQMPGQVNIDIALELAVMVVDLGRLADEILAAQVPA
jgi:hypothetical protein